MKTGNTWVGDRFNDIWNWMPQWSPVMKTGNTQAWRVNTRTPSQPQWSPVMKTGNTSRTR